MRYDEEEDYEDTDKKPMIIMVILGAAVILCIILLIISGNKNKNLQDDLDTAKENVSNLTFTNAALISEISILNSQKTSLTNNATNLITEKLNMITAWNETNFTLDKTKSNLTKTWDKLNDTLDGVVFLSIADTIAKNHTWVYYGEGNASNYVCTNFSKDLVKALKNAHWNATTVTGYLWNNITNGTKNCTQQNYIDFNCSHVWVVVQVPIEATTGEIITPEELNYSYTY